MPKFVQFVEFSTTRIPEIQSLVEKWRADTSNDRTAESSVLVQDRDAPEWYVAIVTFPSYEAAMANSELPATQEFAAKMSEMCKEGPKFCNLDVIEEVKL